MKAVFISHNQALTEKVTEALDQLGIRGYTQWTEVKGRGSIKGEPHMGSHTWPALNNAVLTILDESKAPELLETLKGINSEAEGQGLRAFVWSVEGGM